MMRAAGFVAATAGAAVAVAQPCTPEWRLGGPQWGTQQGAIRSLAVYDMDGGGPQRPLLVVGGGFQQAGGVLASGLASWNGETWSALGPPNQFSQTAGVRGLAVTPDNRLVVAPENGGVVRYVPATNTFDVLSLAPIGGVIEAATVHNGEVIVAGSFTGLPPGSNTGRIVRLSGSSWVGVGPGSFNGPVSAVLSHGGMLYAAGSFTSAGGVAANRVARWDGTSWSALGQGVSAAATSLGVYNGEVVVGGTFLRADGAPARRIARWDGTSWSALGDGLNSTVHAITQSGADLIVTGEFNVAGGVPANRVARWNGSAWSALEPVGTTGTGFALAAYEGRMHVAGQFDQLGASDVDNIASWSGTEWQALGQGLPGQVNAWAVFRGELYAGGNFAFAGGAPSTGLARWAGTRWESQGDTLLQSNGLGGSVASMAVYNDELYVIGNFATAGGVPANTMARWNGTQWRAVGGFGVGVSPFGSTMAVHNGELVVGVSSAQPVPNVPGPVVAWNGSQWRTLSFPLTNAGISTLAVYNGMLYAGGSFSGVVPGFRGVVMHDGSVWRPLGAGMGPDPFNVVNALAVFKGELVAGGNFLQAGGIGVNRLAAWNGSFWQPLGSGVDGPVNALQVYNNELFVGGEFGNAGGLPAARIARWDGAQFRAMGAGLANPFGFAAARAMAVHDGQLIVGGQFLRAGALTSLNWARWGCPPPAGQCYANCDGSTGTPGLTPADFVCFLNRFRAGDVYANCDESTGTPSLTPADFVCFLTRFRSGC